MGGNAPQAARSNVAGGKARLWCAEPGIICCTVLDLSEAGVRVKIFVPLDPMPEFFSIEFGDVYCRARRCWASGHEIGLEFIFDAVK